MPARGVSGWTVRPTPGKVNSTLLTYGGYGYSAARVCPVPVPYSLPPDLRADVGRVKALTREIERETVKAKRAALERRRLIVKLLDAGLSTREVAGLVGLSQSRIQQEKKAARLSGERDQQDQPD